MGNGDELGQWQECEMLTIPRGSIASDITSTLAPLPPLARIAACRRLWNWRSWGHTVKPYGPSLWKMCPCARSSPGPSRTGRDAPYSPALLADRMEAWHTIVVVGQSRGMSSMGRLNSQRQVTLGNCRIGWALMVCWSCQ